MADITNTIEVTKLLAEVDARSKSNAMRLDRLESITEAVYDLAGNMKLMVEKQSQTAAAVALLNAKVSAIEERPAKNWNTLVEKLMWALVAAVVGYIASQLGL